MGMNMSLYDLVVFKHALRRNIDTSHMVYQVQELCTQIQNIKSTANLAVADSDYIDSLVTQFKDLIPLIQKPLESIQQKINQIDTVINSKCHELFESAYSIETSDISADYVRNNRKIDLYEDVEQILKQRVMLHTNWRYPAVEIGCGDGEWTKFLIAADPLYIMDQFQEFLNVASAQFPEQYQNRLRKYLLTKAHDFGALPKNQFAFVFSWNYFNYISLDTLGQILKQMYAIMRPGGIFLFSYNDGDTPQGAGMAENYSQTYIPKNLLIPTCLANGFEIYAEYSFDPNIHWLEIKKPGVLRTVKAHQVLGKIHTIQH
jgi:SAM-dependent methyltransferase